MAYTMTAGNIKIGSAKIWTDNGSGYVAAGFTLDDISLKVNQSWHDRKSGQLGETLVDKVIIGESADIEFSMLETTVNNLQLALPMGTVFSGSGTTIGLGAAVYSSLLTKAVKILLHPINQRGAGGADDETYLDDDVTLWKVANIEGIDLGYKSTEDRVFNVKMSAFADTTKAAGMYLGIIGDPANTTLDVTAPALDDSGTKGVAVLKSAARTRITSGNTLTGVDTPTDILVNMNEALDSGSALNKANFAYYDEAAPDTLIAITTLALDATAKIITVTVPTQTTGHTYRFVFNGLKDIAGNEQTTAISRGFTIA